jgi:hypothetical protein
MGQEIACTVRIGGTRSSGAALLESEALIFRGKRRRVFPFARMKRLSAQNGQLAFEFEGDPVVFELGPTAAKWLEKIRNPKSVIDKLGVKPGARVANLGVEDAGFAKQLVQRAGEVSARVKQDSEIILLPAAKPGDLRRLATIVKAMKRDGAVWVVWPKGRAELKEDHARDAALAVGLVDVKVVAFSPTHSALKLVIPLAKR